MLISSKTKNEKIVLGLLSYTFSEEGSNMDDIKSVLETYREDPNYDILLYKDKKSDNFIGLLCIEINTFTSEETAATSTTITIHRVAVVPSFRSEGVGYHMYELLREKYPAATVIGAMTTVEIITNWGKKFNQANHKEA